MKKPPERSAATRVAIDAPEPIRIAEPARRTAALVVASPHSGAYYPKDLLEASKLDAATLRRSEDAHVDMLFAGAVEVGAPLLAAQFPRAYVDVNRDAYELDPAMFDAPLPPYAATRTPRVAAGLGAIPRVVAAGTEIYSRKLSFAEAAARLDACYKPYHAALRRLIRQTRAAFGTCLLIDAHSMPSAGLACRDDPAFGPIDIVLGDNHGRAADSAIVDLARTHLAGAGYAVALNDPYAGGHVTKAYGTPKSGVHALQIEINRSLYMDEETYAPIGFFAQLQADMTSLMAALAEAYPGEAALQAAE